VRYYRTVLIELARVLGKTLKPDRSVVFVAFTGEEAGRKGSRHYAANLKRYPLEQCIGMLNLDTDGRLGKKKLLVLGAGSAGEWIHIFRGTGYVTGFDVATVNEELDASDHKSFHEAGDVIVRIGSRAVQDLKGLSNILKTLNPGDTISLTYLRERKQMIAQAEVVER
jgi:Zn-dependent M28 family amino/carboxypeptidase